MYLLLALSNDNALLSSALSVLAPPCNKRLMPTYQRPAMITNDLLREKYRVQKALDEKAQYSLTQYVANAHANVKKAEIKYGVKFGIVN